MLKASKESWEKLKRGEVVTVEHKMFKADAIWIKERGFRNIFCIVEHEIEWFYLICKVTDFEVLDCENFKSETVARFSLKKYEDDIHNKEYYLRPELVEFIKGLRPKYPCEILL